MPGVKAESSDEMSGVKAESSDEMPGVKAESSDEMVRTEGEENEVSVEISVGWVVVLRTRVGWAAVVVVAGHGWVEVMTMGLGHLAEKVVVIVMMVSVGQVV